MKKILLVVLLLSLAGCTPSTSTRYVEPSNSPGIETSTTTVPLYMLNPNVNQSNIQNTICKPGYTATIRPSSSYTTKLKKQQLAGKADQDTSHYEEDHWIPLEVGGNPTEPRNLWPEFWSDAHKKDVAENRDHKAVCAGTMTLAKAQLDMYTNWGPR